jgi:hypothetical protein
MYFISQWVSRGLISRWAFSAAKKLNLGYSQPTTEWFALFVLTFIFILLPLVIMVRKKTATEREN